ncbi:MAG: sigma-54 dependent transcriptional regulator [Deferribacteraceae bacterium]|jgi:two-component system nitrogen regulation response regulator NtrX|nr:sigma-54 dependent transcriptional regulator [Deferribacteraceae bacterium]
MRVLVIDDEKNICTAIQGILEDEGYQCSYRLSFEDGFKALQEEQFDVVFLDVWLPDKDGSEGLREIKRNMPELEVVMISGHSKIENAVDSIRWGAYDFLEKPLSLERIVTIVMRIQEKLKILEDLRESKFNLLKKYNLIGASRLLRNLKKKIEKVSPSNAWILIYGENGSGKEHAARLIHMLSKRAEAPFVEINCSSVPLEIIEGELFGCEKAETQKIGKIELANGGTLMLDEIGDLEQQMQAKLLKVLEGGLFTRVGGVENIRSDFRLISTTSKNLEVEVSSGSFREDLYYRINVIPIEIPPLRERPEDIPLLAMHFLEETCFENALTRKVITPELMQLLVRFKWPGNVRQLRHVVERLAVLSETETLSIGDLPDYFSHEDSAANEIPIESLDMHSPLKDARDEFEKQYIIKALTAANWNVSKASRLLDIERSYLHKKMKNYNLEKPTQ